MALQPIDDVRTLMLEALALRGICEADARFIVDDYLSAQIEGHATHGLGKFLLIDAALGKRREPPRELLRRGAYVLVDGGREIGQLAARHCSGLAATMAETAGVGVVALRNAGRYSRLAPYGRMIADRGHVGIVFNNAGPPAVAPPGTAQPVLGTNPVCFSFPATGESLAIDFSTSERVWGEIRQATLEDRPLPAGAFLDQEGRETVDPAAADAVRPFGGHKGFALCLAVELLAGVLAGAAMGLDVKTEYDLGAVFIAMDPGGPTGERAASVARLLAQVRGAASADGGSVRVPGDRSARLRAETLASGAVQVDEATMRGLREMSRSLTGGIESTAKLN